jgi:hypothetical protein
MIRREHVRFAYREHEQDRVTVTASLRFEQDEVIVKKEDCPQLRAQVEARMTQQAMQFVYGDLRREILRLRSHVNSAMAGAADPVALGQHWEQVLGMLGD